MALEPGWIAVAVLLVVALACALAERARRRRRDLDRIGIVNWMSVQLLAIMAALLIAAFTWLSDGGAA
ncbi:hypothetical protein KY084_10590 [Stakelama sp. CBK3Z-3]|uniref:HIG1 domain-containing protein n=1 Tax=Stakelama flava TaxID=2860338 RepID=A0ABS6XM72_9SPHN|nr:hypothetical protein [Stakelama flava]MBW4331319.1 hypothetical protein [Stakelama flava]